MRKFKGFRGLFFHGVNKTRNSHEIQEVYSECFVFRGVSQNATYEKCIASLSDILCRSMIFITYCYHCTVVSGFHLPASKISIIPEHHDKRSGIYSGSGKVPMHNISFLKIQDTVPNFFINLTKNFLKSNSVR